MATSVIWDEVYKKDRKFTQFDLESFLHLLLTVHEKRNGFKVRHVLDLGCGRGELALQFAGQGIQVTAVDFSQEAIAIASHNAKNAKLDGEIDFMVQDLNYLDPSSFNKKFDLITNKLVFAFVKDKKSFLIKVRDLLLKNGVFVLITPVLLPGREYNKHLRGISVPEAEVESLLKEVFKESALFSKNVFGINNNGQQNIYLCSM